MDLDSLNLGAYGYPMGTLLPISRRLPMVAWFRKEAERYSLREVWIKTA
jgi:hypothetical protein